MALWVHLHGAAVHFPIALLLVAVAFDFGAILLKKDSWRTVGFWAFLLGSLFTIPAALSGLTGANGWFKIEPYYVEEGTPTAAHLIQHRNLALIAGGLSLALSAWRVASKDRLRGGVWIVWLLLAIAAAGMIGFVGFRGGGITHGE